jgi:methanogenic corrinoid protein MtbC1
MTLKSSCDRSNFALKLLSLREPVAKAVSDDCFRLHPEWAVRYGESGRQFCTADACFHIEFLAGAIQADSPEAFADYARRSAAIMSARGIDAQTLEENLANLEKYLAPVLLPAEREVVSVFLAQRRKTYAGFDPTLEVQPPDDPLRLTGDIFLAAILGGQRQAALSTVEEALQAGASHIDIYADVISESLHSVGALWEQNRISVAQEHMATAVAQYVIAMIYPLLTRPKPYRGTMVVSGVSGEQHQIGANLVADAMEANGWDVRFLGTNLPQATILSVVEETSADVLCISTTLIANLPSAAELVESVRTRLKDAPRIVLGGAAYRLAPRFPEALGSAEVVLDLRQALTVLCP